MMITILFLMNQEMKLYHRLTREVYTLEMAQTQYGISVRYEPNKVSYLKIRATHFDDYYSDFDPLALNGSNSRRESFEDT